MNRWILYAALLVMFLLHNDWWQWNDPTLVFGLPVGLAYHALFMLVTSVLMFLLVRHAWPDHLEVPDEEAPSGASPNTTAASEAPQGASR